MEPPLFSIVSSSVRFENLAKVSLTPLPESGHNTGAWPSGGRRIVWQQFAERRWRPWRRRLELRPSEWDDLLLSVRLLPVVNTTPRQFLQKSTTFQIRVHTSTYLSFIFCESNLKKLQKADIISKVKAWVLHFSFRTITTMEWMKMFNYKWAGAKGVISEEGDWIEYSTHQIAARLNREHCSSNSEYTSHKWGWQYAINCEDKVV